MAENHIKIKISVDSAESQQKIQSSVGGLQNIQGAMLALNAIPFASQLISGLTELDTGLRDVATLMDETAARTLPRMEKKLRAMSDIPIDFGDLTAGMYDLQSAGHGNEQMFEALRVASYAAMGGLTSVREAADLGTTILNAYKLETSELTNVYDTMFNTVKLGKTTMPELASSIGQIVSSANMAKIPLKDLMSTIATLTLAGIKTPRAMSAMNRAILSLDAPSTGAKKRLEELGITIDVQADGIIKTIGKLKAANLSAQDWKAIIPSIRAQKAVKALVNQFEKLTEVRSRMDKTGETQRAFEIQKESIENQLKLLKKTGMAILTDLGKAVLPVLKPIAAIAKSLTGLFDAVPKPIRNAAVQMLVMRAALGPMGGMATRMVTGFRNLNTHIGGSSKALKNLKGGFAGLSAQVKMMALAAAITFTVSQLTKLYNIVKSTEDILKKAAKERARFAQEQKEHAANARQFASQMIDDMETGTRSFSDRKTAIEATEAVLKGLTAQEVVLRQKGVKASDERIQAIHRNRAALKQHKSDLMNMSDLDFASKPISKMKDMAAGWQGVGSEIKNAEMVANGAKFSGTWISQITGIQGAVQGLVGKLREAAREAARLQKEAARVKELKSKELENKYSEGQVSLPTGKPNEWKTVGKDGSIIITTQSGVNYTQGLADETVTGRTTKKPPKRTGGGPSQQKSNGGGGGGGSMQAPGLSQEELERVEEINERYDLILEAHQDTSEKALAAKNKAWKKAQDELDTEFDKGKMSLEDYAKKNKEINKEKTDFLLVSASLELVIEKNKARELKGITSEAEKVFLKDIKEWTKKRDAFKKAGDKKGLKQAALQLKAAKKRLDKFQKDNIKGLKSYQNKKKQLTKAHQKDIAKIENDGENKRAEATQAMQDKIQAGLESWSGAYATVFTSLGETTGQWIADSSVNFRDFFTGLGDMMYSALIGVIDMMRTEAMASAAKDAIKTLGFPAGIFATAGAALAASAQFIPFYLAAGVAKGAFSKLAQGGLVATPGGITAQIGEAGRELAIPLDNPQALSGVREMLVKMGVGNQNQNININNPILLSDSQIAMQKFTKELSKSMRRHGRRYGKY